MRKITKNGIALLLGAVALASLSSVAQAETRFAVQNAAGTVDMMEVTDSGTIGVGVATPAAGIHLKGTAYPNNVIRAEGNEVTQGAGYVGYTVRTDGQLPLLNDRLGFFLFGTVSGATPLHASGVSTSAEAAWTPTSTPAYFSFLTTPLNSVTRAERMRITGSGNVGIGTTAPTQKLEVNGALRLNTTLARPATCDVTQRGVIWLTQGNSTTADALEACVKDASGNYAWVKLY